MWQDYVMAISEIFFGFLAARMALDRKTVVARKNSVATAVFLTSMAVCQLTLGLVFAAACCTVSVVAWVNIAVFRAGER